MLPRSFYFVRHGETDWNRESRMQGHTDVPLNETGRTQAARAITVFQSLPITRVVVSDLARARETAAILNSVLKLPLHLDAGLRERNFGALEGKCVAEIEHMKKALQQQGLQPEENGYPCPPGGETYADFRDRVIGAIRTHLNAFQGENVLFVAHGGIYRVLRRLLLQDVDQSPNVQPFLFEKTGGDAWVVHAYEVRQAEDA